MSGETEREVSGWTVDTLKEYVEALLKEKDKALNAALVANEKRLDALNELRQGVATKDQIEALEKVVTDLKDRINTSEGQGQGRQLSKTAFFAGLGAVATILGILVILANALS